MNVSLAQVLSGTLLADVDAALKRSGLPVSRLQIEITESMFLGDHSRALPILQELRSYGLRILLDDFGTGFSSLACLGSLPIDVIKVDKGFLESAERDGFAIIRGILSIASALSLEVTAEGVETAKQQAMLTSLGVDRLQGFLFSRPMLDTDVESWLCIQRNTITPDAAGCSEPQSSAPGIAIVGGLCPRFLQQV